MFQGLSYETVLFIGQPYKPVDRQRERLIKLRTDLFYNEYVNNLDTEWRDPARIKGLSSNSDYDILFRNNNSITELSIDEMIKNMRGQVK